jgi:rhomboid protease GluP
MVSVGAGASGAIFGLIGAALVASRRGGRLSSHLRGYVTQWAIYGLAMGFLLGADNAAHLGGLAAGALFAALVSARPARTGWLLLEVLAVALVVASFALAAVS